LREWGTSPDRIQAYHEPRYGIAVPDGSYGYQTLKGFCTYGDPSITDPKARLESNLEDLDVRGDGADPADLSDGVRDQLEQLGYVSREARN